LSSTSRNESTFHPLIFRCFSVPTVPTRGRNLSVFFFFPTCTRFPLHVCKGYDFFPPPPRAAKPLWQQYRVVLRPLGDPLLAPGGLIRPFLGEAFRLPPKPLDPRFDDFPPFFPLSPALSKPFFFFFHKRMVVRKAPVLLGRVPPHCSPPLRKTFFCRHSVP